MTPVDTIVYIDGFNFYYGCVAGTPYKWLNLPAVCERLLPHNNVIGVKYFTARVQARDLDPHQPVRQEIYFRALRTDPRVEIIFGHFLTHKKRLHRVDGEGKAHVWKTEEKGSDVNLAAHLLRDAFTGRFEVAALITNDSDLAGPVQMVRDDVGLKVGVLSPVSNPGRYPSAALTKHATFQKRIRKGVLKASQFPTKLRDAVGEIRKPESW